MKKTLKMSIKEAERLGTMRQIDKKKLTLAKVSEELGLCLRQTKRVRKRYLEHGERGVISLKRGRPSNRKKNNQDSELFLRHGSKSEVFG